MADEIRELNEALNEAQNMARSRLTKPGSLPALTRSVEELALRLGVLESEVQRLKARGSRADYAD